ncbi:MAG: hypothetical protein EBW73_12210 [Betaproteobacteria bacterium]|nr:hypothetical protein [Betaproteobacteria bacterium]
MITSSPALKVSRRIEHPGQFSVGTTLKNWSIFVRHQHSVPESRFKAWPETLRASFLEARTVKNGRVSYRLALMKE